jgi:hypothetical protein
VLSARHGLVEPDEVLEPYDLSLADLDAGQRQQWGHRVAARLGELGLGATTLEVHAGRLYLQALREAELAVCAPVEGLGVGQRLAWYRGRIC